MDLLKVLGELQEIAEILGQTYRARAYHRAILELKKRNIAIDSVESIPGIGTSIASVIHEYLETGHVHALDEAQADPRVIAYRELSGITGVGPATIELWLSKGITSLVSLREAVAANRVTLTNVQSLGLKYYKDLNTRIPRDEVREIGSKIRCILDSVAPGSTMDIAGSYRRGAETAGDIDILVSVREGPPPSLARVLERLKADPGYIGTLTAGPERTSFLYKSRALVRQVDILALKWESYAAALLYFTGSWDFNEAMRGYAKSHGYKLNQRGLYKNGRMIPATTEEEIFTKLGLQYVAPADRNTPAVTPSSKNKKPD